MTYQPKTKLPCPECGSEKVIARGLCKPCYYKHRTAGTLDNYRILRPEDVFHEKYEKTDSCWNWTGTKHQYGYGIFIVKNKSLRAHRFSYELHKGPIPTGLVVLHSCDNPLCVNPDHLSVGTRGDNNRDAVSKGRNAFGERNGHAKLSAQDVEDIRASSLRNVDLAYKYKIDASQISRIRSGLRRTKG